MVNRVKCKGHWHLHASQSHRNTTRHDKTKIVLQRALEIYILSG